MWHLILAYTAALVLLWMGPHSPWWEEELWPFPYLVFLILSIERCFEGYSYPPSWEGMQLENRSNYSTVLLHGYLWREKGFSSVFQIFLIL